MNSNFTSNFFAGNRSRLRELFPGAAPIVITAAGLLQKSADTTYKFSQDRDFWYLTGINHPDFIFVMDRNREYIIAPDRNDFNNVFNGEIDYAELTSISGIEQILDEKQGWKQLGSKIKRSGHVAVISPAPAHIKLHGFYTNPAKSSLLTKIKDINPGIDLLDLRSAMTRLRSIKQPIEVDTIQKSVDLTVKTFKVLNKNAQKYKYEREFVAEASRNFLREGADHAYDPIVAAGSRACILHNTSGSGEISSGDMVLLDIGAEIEYYAADITRVIAPSGMSKRQRSVVDAVVESRDFAFSLLKPGIMSRDYESRMEHFVGEQLRKLGLIKTIEHEAVRKYFPHATSHMLGLDVHDKSDYERPLESQMVLTVEPGIYIPEEGIGVRIEDDVLITNDGIQVLSNNLPAVLE
ncbi:aminopeptidase P N-terminal domain-containing protein [Candidatus Saccharibacteria bacterium]|nr:aminopeptidase P N-terminal domain-containing protein [Candidatus Saccharibacteria bacterium]